MTRPHWLVGLLMLAALIVAVPVGASRLHHPKRAAPTGAEIDAVDQARTDAHFAVLTKHLRSRRFVRRQLTALQRVVLPTDHVVSLTVQWSTDIGIVLDSHPQAETLYASAPLAGVATKLTPAEKLAPPIDLGQVDPAAPRRMLDAGEAQGVPADELFSMELQELPAGSGHDVWRVEWIDDDGNTVATRYADPSGHFLTSPARVA